MQPSQIQIDFSKCLHQRENSPANERHLKENFYRFTGQCAVVLSLLQKGEVLTVASAFAMKPRITSLPRRILDLSSNGVPIEKRWALNSEGKRSHVEYSLAKEKSEG